MNRQKMAFEHFHAEPILHADQVIAEDSLPIPGMHVSVVGMARTMPVKVVIFPIMTVLRELGSQPYRLEAQDRGPIKF